MVSMGQGEFATLARARSLVKSCLSPRFGFHVFSIQPSRQSCQNSHWVIFKRPQDGIALKSNMKAVQAELRLASPRTRTLVSITSLNLATCPKVTAGDSRNRCDGRREPLSPGDPV